ncbi:hypothetical protein FA95DRAFT_1284236 [Auriscalpium vulgare]|uniref:Uncharacterized protein n=1 Tax=Auriscalpium vulgare TaxID=40419 RepID=A0ACB8R310_9AGAM|nr:hypothetical protein FA95DRAFT_1284236 [Auriscalpium vulgare]
MVVWTEPNGVQYALSIEHPERCTKVWSCINHVLPTTASEILQYAQIVASSDESRMFEIYYLNILWLRLRGFIDDDPDLYNIEATATAESIPSMTSSSKSTGFQGRRPTRPWQSLNRTLSSWKKLMKRLSTAISHVEELAGTAPAEHQPYLQAQIVELHDALQRHQDRYEEFVKLSQEYAEQYLRDLSDEIRSQSAWLVLLERRLELAKTLRTNALDLKSSFEMGVCKELKGVRAAVRACPLADEADLLKELDTLIGAIKACYVELDKFWADELRHVTRALKEHRIEPGEVDRWRKFESTLEGILDDGTKGTPALETSRPLELDVKPKHQLDVPAVAVTLIPAIHAIQTSLSSARGFNRSIFSALKPKHLQSLQQVHYNVAQHNTRCMRFLGDCVTYARKAAESACAALSRPAFARIGAALGLRERATALIRARPLAGSVDVPETAGRKVCKAFRELGGMLRDGERLWRTIVDADTHVFAALVGGEERRSVGGCSTKQLTRLLCRMDREKSVLHSLSLASR